jgi:hypothetical protein
MSSAECRGAAAADPWVLRIMSSYGMSFSCSCSCSRSGALFDVRRDKILGLWLNDVPRGEQKKARY